MNKFVMVLLLLVTSSLSQANAALCKLDVKAVQEPLNLYAPWLSFDQQNISFDKGGTSIELPCKSHDLNTLDCGDDLEISLPSTKATDIFQVVASAKNGLITLLVHRSNHVMNQYDNVNLPSELFSAGTPLAFKTEILEDGKNYALSITCTK